MSNAVRPEDATRVVRQVSLQEERRIREALPPRVKKYALEHMNVPLPWAWLWATFQKHGEEGTMKILVRANSLIHIENYGASSMDRIL